MKVSSTLLVMGALASCSERYCTDSDVCWANRQDVIEAAGRCGVEDFEPQEAAQTWLPYVPGEDPDKGLKTRCIIEDLKGQGLMVTH